MALTAENLSASLRYGLGIGPGDKAPTVPEKLAVPEYEVTVGEGAMATPLAEVGDSNLFETLFGRTDLPFARHRQFAEIAARAEGGQLIVVGGQEPQMVHLSTRATGAAGDLVVVIAKRGSHLTLIDDVSIAPSPFQGEGWGEGNFFGRTMILIAEEDARVFVASTASGSTANRFTNRIALIERNAELTWADVADNGAYVKTDIECFLEGEGARAHCYNFITTKGETVADQLAIVHHKASHTLSRIHGIGFADEKSRIIYRALGDIPAGLKGADASEEARFLVLSREAKVDAIPSLDIASREVAATHKLSVSPLSDRELFYSLSRGLSREESKSLILDGLIVSELSCIKNDMIRAIIESKLI